MWLHLDTVRLELPPRRVLRLRQARGATLTVLAGSVWLTVDHDRRDLVLEPGQSHTASGPAALVAMALGPAARVQLCQPARQARPGAWARLRRWLQRSPMMAAVASSSSNSASITRPGTA